MSEEILQDEIKIPNEPNEGIEAARLKDIQHKKLIFGLLVKIIGIAFAILLMAYLLLRIINYMIERNREIFKDNNAQSVVIDDTVPSANTYTDYRSEKFKVSFRYPSEAKLIEPDELDPKTNSIEVFKNINPMVDEKIDEKTLSEGYTFRITENTLEKRTLAGITETKRQSYANTCSKNAVITDIFDATINNKPAKTFEVSNCEPDYKITFVEHEGKFYELAQIYNGNIGIVQKYRSITDEILTSLQFTKTIFSEDELSPYYKYDDSAQKIKFQYSKTSDTMCCVAPQVPGKSTLLLSVYINENSNIVGGFSIYTKVLGKQTFDDYLYSQKQLLKDDYLVVTGKEAQVSEEEKAIGTKPYYGIYLYGYTWQKNTLLYIKNESVGRAYIISIENKDNPSVANELDTVLNSIQLIEKK